ncbi:MAG: hypothetical protein HY929_02100 [Euryarchaeota archaeon]|nr:hypothetical protein [Euryarchaeota archaeon]
MVREQELKGYNLLKIKDDNIPIFLDSELAQYLLQHLSTSELEIDAEKTWFTEYLTIKGFERIC